MNITEFESRVLDQKPVGSGHYDSEYFTGEWRGRRKDGTTWSLQVRNRSIVVVTVLAAVSRTPLNELVVFWVSDDSMSETV